MLTAHRRLLIRRHLPEVEDVNVVYGRNETSLFSAALWLSDGSQIVMTGLRGETRVWRSRRANGGSGWPEILPIEPDLRRRLTLVFGSIHFGGAE